MTSPEESSQPSPQTAARIGPALISDPELQLYQKHNVEKGQTKAFGKEVFTGLAGARKAGIPVLRTWEGPPTRRPADVLISPEGTMTW